MSSAGHRAGGLVAVGWLSCADNQHGSDNDGGCGAYFTKASKARAGGVTKSGEPLVSGAPHLSLYSPMTLSPPENCGISAGCWRNGAPAVGRGGLFVVSGGWCMPNFC